MKKLLVFLFVTLSSVLLFSGCGKKEEKEAEVTAPVEEQVIDIQPEPENEPE